MQTAADRVLSDIGIDCTHISFMNCATAKWNSNHIRVDSALSSMPTDFDEVTLRKVPIFCQLELNQGSYCFIIVTETQFAVLYRVFKERHFKVLDLTFKIL